MVSSERRELRFRCVGEIVIAVVHLAGRRQIEAAEDVEKRRLPAPRRTEQDEQLGFV
jgi:hypothetical protein